MTRFLTVETFFHYLFILYSAFLRTQSRFLQSPVIIQTQSYRWCSATSVATAALGQTNRSVAANQRLQPLRPPPTFIRCNACLYDVIIYLLVHSWDYQTIR